VSEVAESNTAKGLAMSSILWVDDRPRNNIFERQILEALGIKITISESTEDALNKFREFKYDVIISDMGRPPDFQAGYTLLEALKKLGEYPPFIIYAGGRSPELSAITKQRGGWDTTNRPQELFQFVLSALKSRGKL
jgi:CheY-like chemotaxis protein